MNRTRDLLTRSRVFYRLSYCVPESGKEWERGRRESERDRKRESQKERERQKERETERERDRKRHGKTERCTVRMSYRGKK